MKKDELLIKYTNSLDLLDLNEEDLEKTILELEQGTYKGYKPTKIESPNFFTKYKDNK